MTEANTNATTTTAADEFTAENIEKRHFVMPSDAADAQDYIGKVVKVLPGKDIKYNFDQSKPFPDGYDILVLPVSKRSSEGKGNEIVGACIAAVPSVESIMAHEKGEAFIRSAIITAFSIKLGNAVRPKDGEEIDSNSIPQTVEDFIENRRSSGGLEAYNTVAKDMVAALRKQGLKLITVPLLRQVLQSKQFAENTYPAIKQEQWVKVLDILIALAGKAKLDPAVMQNWKDTRDQATVKEIEELDLGQLEGLAA
jgi:hypothetical protein